MPRPSRLTPAVAALLLSAARALAQIPAAPAPLQGTTPAECLQGARDARTRMVMEARGSGAAVDLAKIAADARRLAAACAAPFDVARTEPRQLADLASLYLFIGDTTGAERATERSLTVPGLTPRQRGEAYVAAIRTYVAAADPFAGRVTRAEDLARSVDAFPDSLADLKLAAHLELVEQYEYADVDDGLREHAAAILDVAAHRQRSGAPLPAAVAQRAVLQAYLSLARAAADLLQPESALAVLGRGDSALASTPDARTAFASSRALYALVGTRAAPIAAEHWVNAADTPATVPVGRGRVTLLQFTAHWCKPCRNSYPAFKRIAARFAGPAFQALMVTDLYGVFEGRHVTPAEELAADRTYYGEHWAIPFPVAIALPPAGGGTPQTDEAYHVSGYPQDVVVDKRGIIRQIVSGWDRGNEERLGRLIEQLEREPAT